MTDKSKKGKTKTVIIIALIIGILASVVILWIKWPDSVTEGVSIDSNARAQEESGPDVAIPGWVNLTVPAGVTNVKTLDFYNPEENAHNYYLTFKLELESTGKTIYESGLIEPGKHINEIEISQELDRGRHDAVMHVQPYTMDDKKTPVNNADIKTEIIVK